MTALDALWWAISLTLGGGVFIAFGLYAHAQTRVKHDELERGDR